LPKGSPPMLSDLAGATPLKVHAICHAAAFAGLALAIVLDNALAARAAAAVGLVGSLAFATFTADLVLRLVTQKSVTAAQG